MTLYNDRALRLLLSLMTRSQIERYERSNAETVEAKCRVASGILMGVR